jgi:hypothetical protein
MLISVVFVQPELAPTTEQWYFCGFKSCWICRVFESRWVFLLTLGVPQAILLIIATLSCGFKVPCSQIPHRAFAGIRTHEPLLWLRVWHPKHSATTLPWIQVEWIYGRADSQLYRQAVPWLSCTLVISLPAIYKQIRIFSCVAKRGSWLFSQDCMMMSMKPAPSWFSSIANFYIRPSE